MWWVKSSPHVCQFTAECPLQGVATFRSPFGHRALTTALLWAMSQELYGPAAGLLPR